VNKGGYAEGKLSLAIFYSRQGRAPSPSRATGLVWIDKDALVMHLHYLCFLGKWRSCDAFSNRGRCTLSLPLFSIVLETSRAIKEENSMATYNKKLTKNLIRWNCNAHRGL
jgi:hypothetical protein